VNLAAVWKLPVVFVCENNIYGFSTHYRRATPINNIAERAAAYGITGIITDGMDALDVYEKAGEAVDRARSGGGPTLLECKTYRYMGHSRFEKPSYRSNEELEQWKKLDPIPHIAAKLRDLYGVNEDELEAVAASVDKAVGDAVAFAENSPDPGAADYKKYIYA